MDITTWMWICNLMLIVDIPALEKKSGTSADYLKALAF